MTKVDFKKELSELYRPSLKKFSVVDVPPLNFLMFDGHGNPGTSPLYQQAIETLYAVAFTLKFMSKHDLGYDYVVPPLEGLWWVPDMALFSTEDKDSWLWRAMILTPAQITAEMVAAAGQEAARKKDLPGLPRLRLENFHEGLSVQIMYIDPYADEGPTLARMHKDFIPENGYEMVGKHHEIYLSDPRRTAPAKLRTVLRQPVRPLA